MNEPLWIWQQPNWPHFSWQAAALAPLLRACAKAQGRKALIPYVTAGFPQAGTTVPLMHAMAAAGAVVRAVALQALAVRVAPEVLVEDTAHDCTPRVDRMARRISSCDGSTPP